MSTDSSTAAALTTHSAPANLDANAFAALRRARFSDPGAITRAWNGRSRRELAGTDSRLFIVAADHPARGAMKVGEDALAMADRADLVTRQIGRAHV